MDLHVHRIGGRVVPAVYVPYYRWPQYGVSNSDQQPVRFLGTYITELFQGRGLALAELVFSQEISFLYLHFATLKVRWFSLVQLLMVVMSLCSAMKSSVLSIFL